MKIKEKVPISQLTTMRLGGVVDFLIDIEDPKEIKEAVNFAREKQLPVFILGSGSNTIGKDEGYRGIILRNRILGKTITRQTEDEIIIRGMGGESWDEFVEFSTDLDYSGIEAMSAIPSTLGAAPVQNIGAYGQEIGQVLESVEVFDFWENQYRNLERNQLNLGYRRSIFNHGKQVGRYFILAVSVKLKRTKLKPPFYTSLQKFIEDNQETDFSPKNIRRMVGLVRASKLPDPEKIASAGSFFKNIYLTKEQTEEARGRGVQVWEENGKFVLNSGWLIEEAGLKGRIFSGMRVSDKAALVLINESAKSYADLERAKKEIQKIILDKFGFKLEQEPVEITGGIKFY